MVRHDVANPSTFLRPRLLPGLLALGASVGLACSLTLDLADQQPCSADGDCEYSNGQGECVDGFCVPPGDDDDDDTVGTMGPVTTATTGDDDDDDTTVGDDDDDADSTSGTDSSSGDTLTLDCEVNTDCDEDERCGDDDTCVSLLSSNCTVLQYPDDDDFDRDRAVFLGSIMPTGEPFDAITIPLQNATQLAIEDFNNTTSLPGGRQIAWVACDDTGGASVAEDAARHLVDNVGARAIVGPVFSESVIRVAEEVTVAADTFVITPTASAELLSGLSDNNLVWRVTPSDLYQSESIRQRVAEVAPARLLVLAKDDAYGNGILNSISAGLAADNPGIEIFTSTYENPANFETQEKLLSSYGGVLGAALSETVPGGMWMQPEDHYTHVLILGTSEAEALILSYLSVWAQLYADAPMPTFMLSHGAVPSMEDIVQNLGTVPGTEALAPLRPLLFSRIEGFTPDVFDPDNFAAFNIRYKVRFMNQDALTTSSLSYDATLAAIFAMVTTDAEMPVSGTAIANGMASLNDQDGTAISFSGAGLNFILQARNALAAGNTVDLQGVSGALNWDPDNGELFANLLGWELIGDPDNPTATPVRVFALTNPPTTDGSWMDL